MPVWRDDGYRARRRAAPGCIDQDRRVIAVKQSIGEIDSANPEIHHFDAGWKRALCQTPHDLDPAKVLRVVEALGGGCQRILLVACEPGTFGDEETGAMGLSPCVATAVDEAIKAVERLVKDLLREQRSLEIESA